jgi:uncharacterized protein
MFLASAGLGSGTTFADALGTRHGLELVAAGVPAALFAGLVPLVVEVVLRRDVIEAAGMFAGIETQPAALAYASERSAGDQRVSSAYALVFPAAMIAKIKLLTEDQTRGFLATGEVGRVGITVAALPAIFPVNYRLIDWSIVLRTAPGSKMSAAVEGAVVAFEVDDYQLVDRTGWSVLAVGRPEVIHDLAMTSKVLDAGLEPLADGIRTTIVRIEPTFISGRCIVYDPPPSAT